MIVDVHCHLVDVRNFDRSLIETSDRIFITAGYDYRTTEKTVELVSKLSNVFAVVGIAPQTVLRTSQEYVDESVRYVDSLVRDLARDVRHRKIVGIGEIGLDYHYGKTPEEKEREMKVFVSMLDIAERNGLPVVVHSRKAEHDVIETLENYSVKSVLHCFSGTPRQAVRAVDHGALISVPPIKSRTRKKVIKEVGIEHLVIETDAPYLGSLDDITKSAEQISDVLNTDIDTVFEVTGKNALETFGLEHLLQKTKI